MTSGREALLTTARAGMEISWRYAWASYLMVAVTHRAFPLAETAATLAVSALLTHWLASGNWRLYQVLLLPLAGFIVLALLVIHRVWCESSALFRFSWVADVLGRSGDAPPWYLLALALLCLFLVWRGGRALVKDPQDYIQFDRGLGLFLLLLLVQLIARERAGVLTEDRASRFLVPAFFVFGLASIGLARDRHDGERSFRSGCRGVGIVLAVSAIGVVFAAGLTLLFYPQLTGLAESLQVVLRGAARPAGSVVSRILLFLFSPKNLRNARVDSLGSPPDAGGLPPAADSGWGALLAKVLGVGLIGVIGVLALGVLGFLARYVVRLLLRRNSADKSRRMSTRAVAGAPACMHVEQPCPFAEWLRQGGTCIPRVSPVGEPERVAPDSQRNAQRVWSQSRSALPETAGRHRGDRGRVQPGGVRRDRRRPGRSLTHPVRPAKNAKSQALAVPAAGVVYSVMRQCRTSAWRRDSRAGQARNTVASQPTRATLS